MVSPRDSSSADSPAPTTMNSAFMMLLPAMTRDWCARSERLWISAYSGTM